MQQHYLFIDESGGTNYQNVQHMISAVVVAERVQALKHLVRDARRNRKFRLGKGALHAADDPPEAVEWVLRRLAALEETQLLVQVFDKEWWWNRGVDTGDGKENKSVYNLLIAGAATLAVTTAGLDPERVRIVVERRWHSRELNRDLKMEIAEHTGVNIDRIELVQKKIVDKSSPGWVDCLSVADYLAWGYYQQKEKGNSSFVELIANRVQEIPVGIDDESQLRIIDPARGTFSEKGLKIKKTNRTG